MHDQIHQNPHVNAQYPLVPIRRAIDFLPVRCAPPRRDFAFVLSGRGAGDVTQLALCATSQCWTSAGLARRGRLGRADPGNARAHNGQAFHVRGVIMARECSIAPSLLDSLPRSRRSRATRVA